MFSIHSNFKHQSGVQGLSAFYDTHRDTHRLYFWVIPQFAITACGIPVARSIQFLLSSHKRKWEDNSIPQIQPLFQTRRSHASDLLEQHNANKKKISLMVPYHLTKACWFFFVFFLLQKINRQWTQWHHRFSRQWINSNVPSIIVGHHFMSIWVYLWREITVM